RQRTKPRNPMEPRSGLFRGQGFIRRRTQQQITILGMIKESITILDMGKRPLTILGMEKQPITTLAVGKQSRTMATVTRRLCAARGTSTTTRIGGNNTISLSCWSEADTIIGTRDIGVRLGDTIPTMRATITTDRFTP